VPHEPAIRFEWKIGGGAFDQDGALFHLPARNNAMINPWLSFDRPEIQCCGQERRETGRVGIFLHY
jgi:hypothetical protein